MRIRWGNEPVENSEEAHAYRQGQRDRLAKAIWDARILSRTFDCSEETRRRMMKSLVYYARSEAGEVRKMNIGTLMGIGYVMHKMGIQMLRYHESGEQWVQKAWINQPDLDDEDVEHLTGWSEDYAGPGRPYANKPIIERNGHSILVTQTGGVDI